MHPFVRGNLAEAERRLRWCMADLAAAKKKRIRASEREVLIASAQLAVEQALKEIARAVQLAEEAA